MDDLTRGIMTYSQLIKMKDLSEAIDVYKKTKNIKVRNAIILSLTMKVEKKIFNKGITINADDLYQDCMEAVINFLMNDIDSKIPYDKQVDNIIENVIKKSKENNTCEESLSKYDIVDNTNLEGLVVNNYDTFNYGDSYLLEIHKSRLM